MHIRNQIINQSMRRCEVRTKTMFPNAIQALCQVAPFFSDFINSTLFIILCSQFATFESISSRNQSSDGIRTAITFSTSHDRTSRIDVKFRLGALTANFNSALCRKHQFENQSQSENQSLFAKSIARNFRTRLAPDSRLSEPNLASKAYTPALSRTKKE